MGLDDLPNPRNNVRVRSMVEQREMDAQADDSYRPTPGRISEEEEKGGEDMENGALRCATLPCVALRCARLEHDDTLAPQCRHPQPTPRATPHPKWAQCRITWCRIASSSS